MNRIHMALMAAVAAVSLGIFPSGNGALAQQATEASKQQVATTWFHLSEIVPQPDGCKSSVGDSNGKGLITFSTANGLTRAHYLALPAKSVSQSKDAKPSAARASATEPLALLSAYVVRMDGSPDPAFGSRPQDIVIMTTGDGRVIVTFSDFSTDPDGYNYPSPATVRLPKPRLTNIVQ
jgi:hypothetical protein